MSLRIISNNVILPQGTYNAKYILRGYDITKGLISSLTSALPAQIEIADNLPSSICEEYGLTIATKIY